MALGLLSITFVYTPQAFAQNKGADEISAPAPSSPSNKCQKKLNYWSHLLFQAALLGVLSTQITRAYYMSTAWKVGAIHEGKGILHDSKGIEEKFSAEERKILNGPSETPEDQIKIIETLASRLAGGYDQNYLKHGDTHFPKPRMASSYFRGDSDPAPGTASKTVKCVCGKGDKCVCPNRGICREKAQVLTSELNLRGIEAEVRTASGSETQPNGHEWVFLKKLNMVIDPTDSAFQYKVVSAEEYDKFLNNVGFVKNPPSTFNDVIQYIADGFQR